MTDVLKLTRDVIQRRDDMRMLLGDHYEQSAREYRAILRAAVSAWNMPIAECVVKISKDMSAAGEDPSMVIAAFVDEVEGL